MGNSQHNLPATQQFLKTIEQTRQQLTALLAVKSTTVKIPANIRAAMKSFVNCEEWWTKNAKVYEILADSAAEPATTTAPRSRAAGRS